MSEMGTKETKLVYVKRWRTLVELPAKYADEIVESLRCSAVSAQPSELLQDIEESGTADAFDDADFAILYREVEDSGTTSLQEITNVPQSFCRLIAGRLRDLNAPQSAGTESHSPAAMEGEKDTIVNLIHEHVGFEVLLAIESGVLTGVEKAAEAILAELGRRSQAVSATTLSAPDALAPAQRPRE